MVQALLLFSVYVLIQGYAWTQFCTGGSDRPWCHSFLPHAYPFIQSHYWNQGLFRYWRVKQLPNFAIAAPMIILSFWGLYDYAVGVWQSRKNKEHSHTSGFISLRLLPFMLYWAGFLVIAIVNTHVQTITRFFSPIPPIYWFAAYVLDKYPAHTSKWIL